MRRQRSDASTIERGQYHALVCAWLILCGALVVHVTDEALTGFLSVYNATVLAFKARVPWLPLPVFRFEIWLAGLALLCVLLFSASWLVARGFRIGRILAAVVAVVMVLNAALHTLGTILGHTVSSVSFARPMPGPVWDCWPVWPWAAPWNAW